MALFKADTLRSNNPNAYGIVIASEISGHKSVKSLNDLYNISDAILSISGNNTNNDAIGLLWYVIDENKQYKLIDWLNRKTATGWEPGDKNLSDKIDSIVVPTKVSELTNDLEYQTKSLVNTAILNVIGAAPEALDTLEEIAEKLGDNDDTVAAIVNTISTKADKKDLYGEAELDTGNAVLVNKTTLQKISVSPEDITNYSSDEWEPIGVIAIPSNHNVYGTGECGVIALMSASLTTPDEGQVSSAEMCSGYIKYPELAIFNQLPCVGTNGSIQANAIGPITHALLPIDDALVSGLDNNEYDPGTKYYYDTDYSYAPSPYLADGSRNPVYFQTSSPLSTANALSDFAGKANTEFLCSKATSQQDWKTDATIINKYDMGYSPAACSCWRFHTVGTNQGDWYLPSCGELGYVCVRLSKINNTITILQYHFNKLLCPISIYNGYLTSSRFSASSNTCRYVIVIDGAVYSESNDEIRYVRPFYRLSLKTSSKFYNKTEIDELLDNKVNKVLGKQLSTEDFTTVLKLKLEALEPYDDTAILQAVYNLESCLNTLLDNPDEAINSFNEIVEFLDGIQGTTLNDIIEWLKEQFYEQYNYTVNGYTIGSNPVLTKTDIGLENVDNTSDLNKPISTAMLTALNNKADIEDLSNVLAEEVIDEPLLNEINTLTRERIKKDLLVDMWNEAAGEYGCYNEETGFFELNGLTDISYEEAIAIYRAGEIPSMNRAFAFKSVRTNLPCSYLAAGSTPTESLFYYCTKIEVINFFRGSYWCSSLINLFHSCRKLVRIINPIVLNPGTVHNGQSMFQACYALEEFELKCLTCDLNLSWCANLKLSCFQYMINNAANKNVITITVHPDVYAKLTGDDNNLPSDFTIAEKAQWTALLELAAEKNIQFATV